MGYTVYYKLFRDHALTDAERKRIRMKLQAPGPAGSIAWGFTKLPNENWDDALERLLARLTKLRALLPDVRLEVTDDEGFVKWDAEHGYIVEASRPPPRPRPEQPWERTTRIAREIDADPEAGRATLLVELAANRYENVASLISRIRFLGDLGRELLDQALARGYHTENAFSAAVVLRPDDTAWWLRQLHHRHHAVRNHAARWLVSKNHPLAATATAAVWDSIDQRKRLEHDFLHRQLAARDLGVEATREIDWRAIIAARGEAWMELPPLPTSVELLFEPDLELRVVGTKELTRRRDLRYLSVLSWAIEQGLVLGDPLLEWVDVVPHEGTWYEPARRAAWIRENAAKLAEQEPVPALPLPVAPTLTIDPALVR